MLPLGPQIFQLDPWFVTGFVDKKSFSSKQNSINNNLSLVVWGTNLRSSVASGRITKQESNMIKLPFYPKSIIMGLLLSDGWLTMSKERSKNARLGFKQSLDHSTYVWFVFNQLSPYCSSVPYFAPSGKVGNTNYALGFFTRALPCFTEIYSLFYVNKVKIIPGDIYNILTPVALAHFIMGDGSKQRHGLIICTDCYKLVDIISLMNVLIIRYRLNCTVRVHNKSKYRIYINQSSMALLVKIVSPYMHYSMLYKLNS